jgi:prolipoprotein diacylglyceryl transferase
MIGYINWNTDPEIIKLFGLISLRYYSLLFGAGMILGYLIVKQLYRKENIPIENLDKLTIYIFAGTILGARLGHCLFYEPEYYLKNLHEIFLPFTWGNGGGFQFTGYRGLASHGGAIGVLIAIFIYCRKEHFNFLWVLDKIAIATPVTGMFIRFGNFMNSEIVGKPTNSDFGIVFQRIDLLPRHPTQLYESFAYLLIFLFLIVIYQKQKETRRDGFIFGLFLMFLFFGRFLIEFFKINQVEFESGMFLNMGQLLSIPFIITGIGLIIWKRTPKA